MAGETLLIEEDEDQKGGKPQEVEFVPVTTKQGEDQEDEDDDHPEDSRLSDDNEDREELRRKRREEKSDRAARRKQAIERDKTELNFLRQRNEALEKRMFQVEKTTVANTISGIDARIADTVSEVLAAVCCDRLADRHRGPQLPEIPVGWSRRPQSTECPSVRRRCSPRSSRCR
jgi:hypothetical protein